MFDLLTKPLIVAAFVGGLAVGAPVGYKAGEYIGDSAGYTRAVAEAKFEAERTVANALEEIARDRRNRVNDGLPVDGTDPNDRR